MVQQNENKVTASINQSSITLAAAQNFILTRDHHHSDPHLNEIVTQVVEELSEVSRHTPIAQVIVYGRQSERVRQLMTYHLAMPSDIPLRTLSGADALLLTRSDSDDNSCSAASVYSINTDCYPFSDRFS